MKRIAILVVTVLMSLTATAQSIRYFTYAQAQRTVQYLNAQQEMMLYCGYDYEIETYVLINEVWMERVNSAYYELWVYGYDAYTGDEIYMPLDLQCVWLYSAGRMYNAAQYLRFHAQVRMPSFSWYVPAYHPFTRRMHIAGYVRTYHYDIHRHGWMPPAPPHGGWGPHTQPPLPPYYMRTPQTPAPAPTTRWTPGVDRPQVSTSSTRSGHSTLPTTRPSASGSATGSTGVSTQRNSGAARSGSSSTGSRSTGTATTGTTTQRSTGTTPTRSNTGTSGTSRSTTTTTRSTSTSTGTTGTATRSTTGTSRSTGTTTGTSRGTTTGTSRSSATATPSTSRSTTSTATPSRSASSTATPSRSATSASTSSRSTSATATPSRSTNTSRSTSTNSESRSTTRTGTTSRR